MLEDFDRLEPMLRCPRSGSRLVRQPGGYRALEDLDRHYGVLDGTPVLVDFERSVLSSAELLKSRAASPVERAPEGVVRDFLKRTFFPPKRGTARNVAALIEALPVSRASLVLVIGGGTIGQGMQPLYDHPNIRLVAFDLYKSPLCQFVADAHQIPLCDGCVDAVIAQAVLEHVLCPAKVVDEIWRVLRPGGIVYAETPFLQQVHEGEYDFARFTESGHRYLFKRFALLRSGPSGGPGTQLLWSLDYFFRGLFRSRLAGKLAKLAFCWLRYFDRLIPEDHSSDGASGVFFLGRKSNVRMRPKDAVAFYRGAQRHARTSAAAAPSPEPETISA